MIEVIYWIVTSIAGLGAIVFCICLLVRQHRQNHPPLCLSCKHLQRYKGDTYNFKCNQRIYDFDKAPEFCSDYRRRDEDNG